MKNKHDGPSESGYHFVQSYKNCKRKHFYTYIKALEPLYLSPALLLGTAGHVGLEEWYRKHKAGASPSQRAKAGRDAALGRLDDQRDLYFDPAKVEVHRRQLIDTFQQYGLEYYDENFKVLGVEHSLSYTLPTGDIFTGRVDLSIMNHNAQIMIMDHKFTGWNLDSFKRTTLTSDQAIAYLLLWNKNHPDKRASGVIFNIIRNYQGNTTFLQVPIYRTQKDIDQFEAEITEELGEMAQRLINPNAQWSKNTDHCFAYNQPCAFLELCQGSKFDGLIGIKFKQKELLDE